MLAEIITIGDEILIGQVIDTNSAWLAQQLNAEGIHLQQINSVADTPAAIISALTQAAGRTDLILVTGGLGPTKDDVTKQAMATYFNCGIRRDPHVFAHVEAIFKRSNRPMLEINRKQADVLDVCEVLSNELGTAPGMWIDYNGVTYVVMPGVPFEMKRIMQNHVRPRLHQFQGRLPIWHRTLLTGGIGESFLAKEIAAIEVALPPHIQLAYLPEPGLVRLRLTAIGQDLNTLKQETQQIAHRIKMQIGDYFLAEGDITLPSLILNGMQKERLRLATAESCTGGNISRLITAVPGSSAVFEGGAVTYSNALKIQLLDVKNQTLETHGAVSKQTVLEMALGAQRNFNAHYAVAVSGVAGPDGGNAEKPVGSVWVAVAGKQSAVAREYRFGTDRQINIERASTAALLQLWKLVKSENPAVK